MELIGVQRGKAAISDKEFTPAASKSLLARRFMSQ